MDRETSPLMRGRAFFAAAIASLLLSGCAAQLASQNAQKNELLVKGDYAVLARDLEKKMGIAAGEKGGQPGPVVFKAEYVLEHLEAAEAWRLAGRPKRALAHFDAAEASLKGVDNQNMAEGAGRQAGAVLLNDTVLSYRPSPAEAVLINYYKAIAFLSLRDPGNARVEFNRADDRIRRSVERYQKELGDAVQEAEKTRAGGMVDANPGIAAVIGEQFSEMRQWKPYASFVVPPASYLQGLQLGRSGDAADLEKARETIGRVAGMTESPVVARDFRELEQGRLCPSDDCVWIMAEFGRGPHLVERRVDLPIPTQEGLITLSMALPALESRMDPPLSACAVSGAGREVGMSELATMDRVVQTEFQKRFPAVVTRSVASAAVKAVAQNELNKKGSPIAALMGNIAAMATTAADTRMWQSLPGRFMVSRIERPADGVLAIRCNRGERKIVLPNSGAVLLHVKQLTADHEPTVSVLEL